MKPAARPIADHLAREVAARRLEFDAGQLETALRLDALAVQLAVAARARRFWQPQPSPPRGVYLWGGVGRGKTFLMDLFFESLSGVSAERDHFYRFMQTVHRELRAAAHRSDPLEDVAGRLAGRARVICLDEFLVLDIADAMLLAGLLAGLFRRGVTLVATSNRPPGDLYKDGLQRQRFLPAIELLQQNLDVIELNGATDYRLRRLEHARTYWDSRHAGADAELRALFRIRSEGPCTGPITLHIEDRPIAAVDTSDGVAWFEFGELCETARSAADYLELARRFHTLFVARVPVFTGAQDDAARRFVMLIDTLYDRGAALVVSAAAEPAELYRGERLRFEFQRTASRLTEMRSQRYLSRLHTD